MFYLIGIVISLWIIFWGGAKVLENTVVAYFEFGPLGEKAPYIKVMAWLGLIICIGLLLFELK